MMEAGKEVSSALDEGGAGLVDLSFVEDQKSALWEVLVDINAHIDGAQNNGEECFPMGRSMYDVDYIREDKVVLNSRKQAPYLMCVEVLKSKASNDLQKLSRGGILVAKGETLLPKPPWAYPLRTGHDLSDAQLKIANGGVPKGGGMNGATHRQAHHGEVIGEDMGKQFDVHVGRLSKVTGGLVTYEGAGACEFADKKTAGNNTIHMAVLAAVTLSKSLCFGTQRAFGYFSKCLGSEGRVARVHSLFDPLKLAAFCNLKGLRRLLVVQSHHLSMEWLLVWFPKPIVKMKLEEDEVQEVWLHDSLRTRNLMGDALLRS